MSIDTFHKYCIFVFILNPDIKKNKSFDMR